MEEAEEIKRILSSKVNLKKVEKSGGTEGLAALGDTKDVQNLDSFGKIYTHYAKKIQESQAQQEITKVAGTTDKHKEEIEEIRESMREIHARIEAELRELSQLRS